MRPGWKWSPTDPDGWLYTCRQRVLHDAVVSVHVVQALADHSKQVYHAAWQWATPPLRQDLLQLHARRNQ